MDITMNDITSSKAIAKREHVSDDSDSDSGDGPRKVTKLKAGSSASSPEKRKSRRKVNDDGPSDAVIAAWRKGDDDLEPSSKMLALVDYLKEWDSTGEKTICYSQCDLVPLFWEVIPDHRYRDINARPHRDSVLTPRYSKSAVRWKNGQDIEGCNSS